MGAIVCDACQGYFGANGLIEIHFGDDRHKFIRLCPGCFQLLKATALFDKDQPTERNQHEQQDPGG